MNKIENSYELLLFLKKQELLEDEPKYWWPAQSDFEILIGAILTQNTKWINVEQSFDNLKELDLLSLEKLSKIDLELFIKAITPSGFKNQKSIRIKALCNNIIDTYKTFDNFKKMTTRAWLLDQKGIGEETADAIYCYACHKNEMVVDKYTNRLLNSFGYTFDSYLDLKQWLEYGINENFDKIIELYGYDISLNQVYCRFHGKIVEFMKSRPKG